MVRDRFQELIDFATTESPYKDANKGWVTNDIYFEWSSSKDESKASSKGIEMANFSLYWKPINKILSILFAVIALAAIFVFVAVSVSHGGIQLPLPTLSNDQIMQVTDSDPSSVSEITQKNASFSDPTSAPAVGVTKKVEPVLKMTIERPQNESAPAVGVTKKVDKQPIQTVAIEKPEQVSLKVLKVVDPVNKAVQTSQQSGAMKQFGVNMLQMNR